VSCTGIVVRVTLPILVTLILNCISFETLVTVSVNSVLVTSTREILFTRKAMVLFSPVRIGLLPLKSAALSMRTALLVTLFNWPTVEFKPVKFSAISNICPGL